MNLHGGNIYDYEAGRRGAILDFSSNINPYGPPAWAIAAAREALEDVNRYPDARQTLIKNAFAEWLDIAAESLLFGNGASDLIPAVLSALKPGRVLIVSPTFAEYEVCAARLGTPAVCFETGERDYFAFPVERIEADFCPGDLIVVCQPNNPTGRSWSAEELRTLAALCGARGGWLMADECFINLSDPPAASCLDLIGGGGVLVLRAITKDFSAPGLRVGFLAARADLARKIRNNLQPWPLNCAGEAFAIACASNPEPFLSDSRRKIALERARVIGKLAGLPYKPFPSTVNYLLLKSLEIRGEELQSRLLKENILIRRCANFPSLDDSFFRIAIRGRRDNEKFAIALAGI